MKQKWVKTRYLMKLYPWTVGAYLCSEQMGVAGISWLRGTELIEMPTSGFSYWQHERVSQTGQNALIKAVNH